MTTTNPLWEMRRSIRNFNFTQEQEVLDLMFTIAVKMSNTTTLPKAVIDRVIDGLDDICGYLEEEIAAAEDERQHAIETGLFYKEEAYEHNPDDTL